MLSKKPQSSLLLCYLALLLLFFSCHVPLTVFQSFDKVDFDSFCQIFGPSKGAGSWSSPCSANFADFPPR